MIIEVICIICTWSGRIPESELDGECPGCHEWESLGFVSVDEVKGGA